MAIKILELTVYSLMLTSEQLPSTWFETYKIESKIHRSICYVNECVNDPRNIIKTML